MKKIAFFMVLALILSSGHICLSQDHYGSLFMTIHADFGPEDQFRVLAIDQTKQDTVVKYSNMLGTVEFLNLFIYRTSGINPMEEPTTFDGKVQIFNLNGQLIGHQEARNGQVILRRNMLGNKNGGLIPIFIS